MMALIFGGVAVVLIVIAAYSLAKTTKDVSAERAPSGEKNLETPIAKRGRRMVLGIAAAAAVLLIGTAVLYSTVGLPRLPRQGSRSDALSASSPEALAKQLQGAPTPSGFKKLANMYFTAGQFDKAVSADHRAIELGADDSGTWSEFGESIVMAGGGQVQPQALAAFINTISRDPHDARARFYIGMAEAQIGSLRQAVAIWRDLEKGADPNAKWLPMVRQHIVAFSQQGGFDPKSVPPAAPSVTALRLALGSMRQAISDKVNASGGAAPAGRTAGSGANTEDAMIRAMVESLATRLKTSPNDEQGWRRLAHAYDVLGEPDKAQDAIAHAVRLSKKQ